MASTPRPIRWLHLSDLHYGCPGKVLWEQVEGEFFDDVAYWVDKLGPPDLSNGVDTCQSTHRGNLSTRVQESPNAVDPRPRTQSDILGLP